MVEFTVVETLDAVWAEGSSREIAATQRLDQPIEDDQVRALWQKWPKARSENACYRSIDGVTTQNEEDPQVVANSPACFFHVFQPRHHLKK